MAETGTLHDAFIDELRDAYDAERQLTKALRNSRRRRRPHHCGTRSNRTSRKPRGRSSGWSRSSKASTRRPAASTAKALPASSKKARRSWKRTSTRRRWTRASLRQASAPNTTRWRPTAPLIAWARAMGHDEAADLLQENLDEEKAADEKLSDLAEGGINQSAVDAAHPDEGTGRRRSERRQKRFREGESRAPLNENRAGQVLRPHR